LVSGPLWRRVDCLLTDAAGDGPIDESSVHAITAALGYRAPQLEGRDGEFSVEVPDSVARAVCTNGLVEHNVDVDGRRWWFIAERDQM
jgi:hypothetical protein